MRQYSRRKKALYLAISLIFSVVIVEIGLHVLYVIVKHRLFPIRSYDEAIHRIAAPRELTEPVDRLEAGELKNSKGTIEAIHPYLGFVLDPQKTPSASYLGFPVKSDDPFVKTSSSAIAIAIFGGSFAAGTSLYGGSAMQSTLREHGIDARILTMANGGYKQPQQLFALAYLLSHDASIDVVVNIDGFNEVALPEAENLPKGVNPFYPRAWYIRTLRLRDRDALRLIGRSALLQDDRRRWAMKFRALPKLSIIRNVVWRAYDNSLRNRIMSIADQIRRSKPLVPGRFLTTGPDMGIGEESELYRRIAGHWRSCSLLMKALCDSRGIAYVHVLQPNQYFEAGRAFTETEKQRVFREDHPYRPGVVRGYPRLLAAKSGLLARGVDFHDLTMIYRDVPQPIYEDDCCHPNRLGYNIIAEHVAHAIAGAMAPSPQLSPPPTDGDEVKAQPGERGPDRPGGL